MNSSTTTPRPSSGANNPDTNDVDGDGLSASRSFVGDLVSFLHRQWAPNTVRVADCGADRVPQPLSIPEKKDSTGYRRSTSRYPACRYPPDSYIFALRVCVVGTISALFYTCHPYDGSIFHHAIWIYVMAISFSWTPSIDTASVVKMAFEMFLGTMVGALLGLAVGFIVWQIRGERAQNIFLVLAIACHGFVYSYTCDRLNAKGGCTTVTGNYMFGTVALAFLQSECGHTAWEAGLFLWLDIFFASSVVALVAVLVFPVSTARVLVKDTFEQTKSIGESIEMVTEAAITAFTDKGRPPMSLVDIVTDDNRSDAADQLVALVQNKKQIYSRSNLFPMLQHDPLLRYESADEHKRFCRNMADSLSTSIRVQIIISFLGYVAPQAAIYSRSTESIVAVKGIGQRCKTSLDPSIDLAKRDTAVKELLQEDLDIICCTLRSITTDRDSAEAKMPRATGNEHFIMFFQLLQQLIVHVAQLHRHTKEYESIVFAGAAQPKSSQTLLTGSMSETPSNTLTNSEDDSVDESSEAYEIKQTNHPNQMCCPCFSESAQKLKFLFSQLYGWHRESFIFASRIAFGVACASLIYLVSPTDNLWFRQAIWMYITAAAESWQCSIDTATVVKSTLEQTAGTMTGAFIGLAVGNLSLLVNNYPGRMIFLTVAIAVHGFAFPFTCDRMGLRGSKAAQCWNYSYGAVALAFTAGDPYGVATYDGLFRVLNIFFGCIITVFSALVVWPVSTKKVLVRKATEQAECIGKSIEMVMKAATTTSLNEAGPQHHSSTAADLITLMMKNEKQTSENMGLFPMLKYDPWYTYKSMKQRQQFRRIMTNCLTVSVRIQSIVSFIDSVAHKGVQLEDDTYHLVISVGQRCKKVLDSSLVQFVERDVFVRHLKEHDLSEVRSILASLKEFGSIPTTTTTTTSGGVSNNESTVLMSICPIVVDMNEDTEQQELKVVFFQLVEQLIVQVLKWHCERKKLEEPVVLHNRGRRKHFDENCPDSFDYTCSSSTEELSLSEIEKPMPSDKTEMPVISN